MICFDKLGEPVYNLYDQLELTRNSVIQKMRDAYEENVTSPTELEFWSYVHNIAITPTWSPESNVKNILLMQTNKSTFTGISRKCSSIFEVAPCPSDIVDILIPYVDDLIYCRMDENLLKSDPMRWQASEAIFNRAWEGIKSSYLLAKVGYGDTILCLGAAFEALCLLGTICTHKHVCEDAKRLFASSDYNDAKRYRDFYYKQLGADPPSVLEFIEKKRVALDKFNIKLNNDGFAPQVTGFGWQSLACNGLDRRAFFGDKVSLQYLELMGHRNNIAHSRSAIWESYCRFQDDDLNNSWKIMSAKMSVWVLFVLGEFFAVGSKIRTSIPDPLEHWCYVLGKQYDDHIREHTN